MKLQNKLNIRFLVMLLVVFILAGGILYFVISWVVNESSNEILKHRAERVMQKINKQAPDSVYSISSDNSIIIHLTPLKKSEPIYSDTLLYDISEKEMVYYRKLYMVTSVDGKNYEITILLSKMESEDLIEAIFFFFVGLFACIVLILFFLNQWLSSSLWQPFYKILDSLKLFKIGQKNDLYFEKSGIYEFEQLNKSLELMVNKAQTDFNNLKEFTENASHEIQTPLAVMKSKLESVLQDKTLPEHRYQQIQSAYQTITRLSKLNEALLLLSKIENRQFTEEEETDLCKLITRQIDYIEELIELKKVSVSLDFKTPFILVMNPFLAEILINNLLNNALKHNIEGGNIVIVSSLGKITISNSGKPLTIAPEKLFQRFIKQNTGSESTGLGLAIVAEICNIKNLQLEYKYAENMHSITLFKNEKFI